MLAGISTAFGHVILVLTIHGLVGTSLQLAAGVVCEQWIPEASPDYLDHIPACSAKVSLQLLNDLAIASHGSIETLQITVDHKYQVVEVLATGQRQRSQ